MKKNITYYFLLISALTITACVQPQPSSKPITQKHVRQIDSMANIPQPLEIIDWKAMAQKFDNTVFNFNTTGDYWPLVWWDSTRKNYNQPVVGVFTAIGDERQGTHNKGMFHEALANMGAVLGATLTGIDKSNQNGINYVGMLKNYFNRETGWNIMMNNTCPEVALLGGGYGRDWWYDVYPNMLFYAIYNKYPDQPGFDSIAHSIAEKFCAADSILKGNYDHSFFDYGKMQPMKNNICMQQDAAAGHAYVLYAAYKKFGDERYLKAAKNALSVLEKQPNNTYYEIFMPFGAYMAARLNAEQGTAYNTQKMLTWTFDGSPKCREGWGTLVGNWNGIDISGIVGSTVDRGGYGFLMNTFDQAWPLVPMVRYDASYANAIGKWMLNAANAARLFYPQYMPKEHQTIPEKAAVTKGVIAYEGIIHSPSYPQYKNLKAPVAQGDGPLWAPKNPDVSQFSIYGSGHVGIFGSVIKTTEVPAILQLDLLATDFFHDKAYPSYLYYNPYTEAKKVTITLPNEATDIYNTVTRSFIAKKVKGSFQADIAAQSGAVLVFVPSGAKIEYKEGKMLANGVTVAFGL